MFAPRQAVAAAELVRVARPGGRIVVAAWTPNGMVGRMFRASARYMPPPPEGFVPPVMWGEEQHVRGLFEDSDVELKFELRTIMFEGDSVEAWVEQDERILGPSVMAKAALERQGRYDELRQDVVDLYGEFNQADDGSFRAPAEYLISVAQLAG
jgi:SAM-dependent methyltransferase